MPRSHLLLIASALLSSVLAGCYYAKHSDESDKGNLTFGVVKQAIQVGQTTGADILKTFGSPNIVTKNKKGKEVWNYSRMSFRTSRGETGLGILFFRYTEGFSTSASSNSFDLVVEFDEHDVVSDYRVIATSF